MLSLTSIAKLVADRQRPRDTIEPSGDLGREDKAQFQNSSGMERRGERHRKRLINAAEGWLFLADQLRRLEKSLGVEETL